MGIGSVSVTRYINPTPGQAPKPRVTDQHKKDFVSFMYFLFYFLWVFVCLISIVYFFVCVELEGGKAYNENM